MPPFPSIERRKYTHFKKNMKPNGNAMWCPFCGLFSRLLFVVLSFVAYYRRCVVVDFVSIIPAGCGLGHAGHAELKTTKNKRLYSPKPHPTHTHKQTHHDTINNRNPRKHENHHHHPATLFSIIMNTFLNDDQQPYMILPRRVLWRGNKKKHTNKTYTTSSFQFAWRISSPNRLFVVCGVWFDGEWHWTQKIYPGATR